MNAQRIRLIYQLGLIQDWRSWAGVFLLHWTVKWNIFHPSFSWTGSNRSWYVFSIVCASFYLKKVAKIFFRNRPFLSLGQWAGIILQFSNPSYKKNIYLNRTGSIFSLADPFLHDLTDKNKFHGWPSKIYVPTLSIRILSASKS